MSENKDNHGFSVSVAQEIGVHRAIMLQHIRHLQISFVSDGKEPQEMWIKRSRRALNETYPYLSEKEIRGCLDRLERDDYLRVKVDNALNYDRTKSYQLSKKGWELIGLPPSAKKANRDKKASAKKAYGIDKRANDNVTKGPMNIGICSSVVTSFVECEKTRFAPPAPAESSNLKEEKTEIGLVAPPPAESHAPRIGNCDSCEGNGFAHGDKDNTGPCDDCGGTGFKPTHLVKLTGPENPGVMEAEGIALPVATTAITYDQYPLPKTGLELQEKMRAYFMMYPNEWEVSVLQTAKATSWEEGKTEDCMLRFCLHKEKTGDLKKTYHQYRADLTLWFMNQRQFDRPAPGPAQQRQPAAAPSALPRSLQGLVGK